MLLSPKGANCAQVISGDFGTLLKFLQVATRRRLLEIMALCWSNTYV